MFDLLSFDENPDFYNSGRAGVAEWGQPLRTWRHCSNGTKLMGSVVLNLVAQGSIPVSNTCSDS
jgi:hypothetical protein